MEDPKRLEEGSVNGTRLETEANGHRLKKDGENIGHDNNHGNEQKAEQPGMKQKTKRVATLDAFRGLTIVVRERLL